MDHSGFKKIEFIAELGGEGEWPQVIHPKGTESSLLPPVTLW